MTVITNEPALQADLLEQNEQLWSDIRETSRQLELATAELARLRAENERLREVLAEVYSEFLSGNPCETHGDWCLTHSTYRCNADELRAKVLQVTPKNATPEPRAES